MTPGLYHYYVTELAFYWSLVFSQFTDIKRKVSGNNAASVRFEHNGRATVPPLVKHSLIALLFLKCPSVWDARLFQMYADKGI